MRDHRAGIDLLEEDKVDAYFADRAIIAAMLYEGGRPGFQLSKQYFSYETHALALPRGDEAFRLLVDRTLARLYRSGRINAILAKTFGKAPRGRHAQSDVRHQFAARTVSWRPRTRLEFGWRSNDRTETNRSPRRQVATAMTTAEATVATLLAHGIDTLYALPGVHNDHLFDALFKAGDRIRTVHTRHEQGAAYMALGAALATGKPQAYAVVPGPGLLNSGAALLTAYSA